jgi:glutathionylspermidine synthase
MQRQPHSPRPNWIEKVERLGLGFHTVNDQPYWNEAAGYRFEPSEIAELESASLEVYRLCLEAVEWVIQNQAYDRLGIPPAAQKVIDEAWDQDPPAIYGRFDFAYDGTHPPKLLEFNADTPTSLLEAAVVQWHWLQETHPDADQFNSIWEGLVDKWKALIQEGLLPTKHVHFACMNAPEDLMTTMVLLDTAREVGLSVELLGMAQIGWDHDEQIFVDPRRDPIHTIFKLYPWEWMVRDEFGENLLRTYSRTQWIEPIWKMILSNKGILPILWELFPDHPNLLPAYADGPRDLVEYVKKPFLGREGANVVIQKEHDFIAQPGPYDDDHVVYQAYQALPVFDGNHAVIGSWIIDGEARGIGVRESDGPITGDLARFVPHYFLRKSGVSSS